MIIDIHTHAFPDAVAPKAKAALCANLDSDYVPTTDLTAGMLEKRAEEWGIDHPVLQPVVTAPKQIRSINLWAAQINEKNGRLISFGGVWPGSENYKEDVDLVVSLGLKGIKLHPEYQQFFVDDPAALRLYDYAFSKGLVILQHAGYDPAYKPPFHSDPHRFAAVADAMRGGQMILAHLGGQSQWDDVEKYVCGKDGLYLDTSMGSRYYPKEQLLRIIRAHGADKILFGTDTPWSDAGEELAYLRSLPLGEDEKAAILGGNAERLLGL